MDISRKIVGFYESEILEIRGNSLRECFFKLGRENKKQIADVLFQDLPKTKKNKKTVLKYALSNLRLIERLAKSSAFVIDGANWLSRYLQAFYATCRGAEISLAEGALLQIEASTGCQSLVVQDRKTGEIRAIHTEEDDQFGESDNNYPYKVVSMEIGSKKVIFFGYPDIFGWGCSVGINEEEGYIQLVEDLLPKGEYNNGKFWSSIASFMTLDAGEVNISSQIMEKLKSLERFGFNGGYSIHMMQSAAKPDFKSYEFIYNKVKTLVGKETLDRYVIGQTNLALSQDLQKYCLAGFPAQKDGWDLSLAGLYVEMSERVKRLFKIGAEAEWLGKDAKDSIKQGLEILADPRGDVGKYTTEKGKKEFLMTGLPSYWTVSHFVCYIGSNRIVYYLGKLLPRPIKGREYSVRYQDGYKYVGKEIREEAKKVYNDFLKC